jgi:hypothetical protein
MAAIEAKLSEWLSLTEIARGMWISRAPFIKAKVSMKRTKQSSGHRKGRSL